MENIEKIPEAALDLIGKEKVRKVLVTERDIHRFAQAVDQEPDYVNGEILAPPLFCQSMTYEEVPFDQLPQDGTPLEIAIPLDAEKTVGGSSDYTFYRQIKAGETITVVSKLMFIKPKKGRSGEFFLVGIETSFKDAEDKLVAQELASYVKRS